MQIAVVSPHRDDAAFSCGALLWALRRSPATITVVNLFTRSVYAPYLPATAAQEEAMVTAVRRAEDDAFLRRLHQEGVDAKRIDLHLFDAPLRLALPVESVVEQPLRTRAHTRRSRGASRSACHVERL